MTPGHIVRVSFQITYPETKENKMATNPYDRRTREQRDGKSPGFSRNEFALAAPPPSLAIDDLNALVSSAVQRGEAAATQRLLAAHQEERLTAQREAWDAGHEAGKERGRGDLVGQLDEQYGETVRLIHNQGRVLLNKMTDPRKVTKPELEKALDLAVEMLGGLIEAQHQGFVPEVPS